MDDRRERAIYAAIVEMSLFSGNLEMKVRKAIERYEMVMDEPCRTVTVATDASTIDPYDLHG